MPLAHLDLVALRRWVITARADLAAYADALNHLNVFPVPDGDTGTNLLMTVDGALAQLGDEAPSDIQHAAATMSEATLTSARGNSGVILSQLTRGIADVLEEVDDDTLDGHHVAAILSRAARLARDGVSRPEGGTVLSVASAAASAAVAADAAGADLAGVVDAAVAGAGEALIRTRTEHEVLRRAGVVDAGGAGYLLVIEALQRVVRGDGGLAMSPGSAPEWLRISLDSAAVGPSGVPPDVCASESYDGGPAYEVMFLLAESDDARVRSLKQQLDTLGDSLVVAGGPRLWSVHVHVDDVAAAVNHAVDAGRPHRFVISRFADEDHPRARGARIVAIVRSDGVAEVAQAAGAEVLRSAAEEVLHEAFAGHDVDTIVLCGGAQIRQAVEHWSIGSPYRARFRLIGASSVEIIAALAVLDHDQAFEVQLSAVQDAADTVTWSEIVGGDSDDVVMRQARAFIDESVPRRELVTLVTGEHVSWADDLASQVRAAYPHLEVLTVVGGAGEPTLTIGVE